MGVTTCNIGGDAVLVIYFSVYNYKTIGGGYGT